MWASKGVRKCAILYYKVLCEPVIPETKRQGKVGFVFHIFFYLSGGAFFPKAMLSGEFP